MERLGAQSAQVEDLCAAVVMLELQSMTDIQLTAKPTYTCYITARSSLLFQ